MPQDIRPSGYFPQGTFIIPATQIERQRKLAEQIRQGMTHGPVQSWTQGAARIANALGSVLQEDRANQMEQQRNSALAEAMKSGMPIEQIMQAGLGSGDITFADVLKYRQNAEQADRAAKLGLQPIWGKINGKSVAFQPNNQPGGSPQQIPFPENFIPDEPVQWMDDGRGNIVPVPKRGNLAPSSASPAPVSPAPEQLPGEPDFSNVPPGQPLPQQLPPGGPAAPAPTQGGTLGPVRTATPGEKAGATKEAQLRADLKFDAPQLEQSLNNSKLWMSNTVKSIDDIMASPGLGDATGRFVGSEYGQPIAGYLDQNVKNTQAQLQTLKAQVTQAALQNMRDNSKHGGALGQVSNYEDKLLMDMIGALDLAQDKTQFVSQLNRIKDFMTNSAANRERAYQQDLQLMGGAGGAAPPPPQNLKRKTKGGVNWGF